MEKVIKKSIIISFIFLCIYVSYHNFYINKDINKIENSYIGAYIDGEYTETLPAKDMVIFEKVECDNGASATWDNDAWGLLTTNMTKRTKCNIYFKNRSLKDVVIASLDTSGKCLPANADGSVTIENIEDGSGYVCSAPDRFGTTYYYRGDVKNNNVYFAGFYWQIIRVNGDGSIRLIYNGITPNATGANQSINATTYQFNSTDNNPAYVGYMYGNTIGTRENNIKNEVNSTIKTTIDAWYKTNIDDKGYSRYLADGGFCNDRSLSPTSEGDGVKKDKDTKYGAFDRHERKTAIFTCPNEESDLFTLKSSNYGNKALTYPVGLITYDELNFAGMDLYHLNKSSWVYSTQHYWTVSPSVFNATNGHATEWFQNSDGYLSHYWVASICGARPVINLSSETLITDGDGSAEKPFTVKTNVSS